MTLLIFIYIIHIIINKINQKQYILKNDDNYKIYKSN